MFANKRAGPALGRSKGTAAAKEASRLKHGSHHRCDIDNDDTAALAIGLDPDTCS